MSLLTHLQSQIPDGLNKDLTRLATFWKTVHDSVDQPACDTYTRDLRELSKLWTGFGAAFASGDPGIALFFRGAVDPELVKMIPATPHHATDKVHSHFNVIPPGPYTPPTAPITPGVHISWICGPTGQRADGTLGAFLYDQGDPRRDPWLLSAHHVIGRIERCRDNTVELPDLGLVSHEVLSVPARDYPADNLADAAVAHCRSIDRFEPDTIGGLPRLTSSVYHVPGEGIEIVKAVATPAAQTRGRVAYLGYKLEIDMSAFFPGRSRVHFTDQILIADEEGGHFSHPGDSGSLVVHVDEGKSMPVGLLIANNVDHQGETRHFSAVTPMDNVIRALNQASSRCFEILTRR